MSALVPFKDPERGDGSPMLSRNNSVSTLSPPKVPEVSENSSNGNCMLNVNKSTNKVNSELTTVTETADKKLSMLMCNGPKKKVGGWGRLKAKAAPDPPPTDDSPSIKTEEVPADNTKTSSTKNLSETEPPDNQMAGPAGPKPNSFKIPKLSLSSDSETIVSSQPAQAAAITVPVMPIQPPEYTQMMANLMDFKVANEEFDVF